MMDPEKWKIGGPLPEPGDLDEEIEAGNVVVTYCEPVPNPTSSVISEDEAERIRLKPEQVPPQP